MPRHHARYRDQSSGTVAARGWRGFADHVAPVRQCIGRPRPHLGGRTKFWQPYPPINAREPPTRPL
jgi:hypothetical protein